MTTRTIARPALPAMTLFDRLLLVGAVLLLVLIAGPVLTIPLHIPINYNEGWNAGFDTRATIPGSGPLYPGTDTFVFNNYPPLGFIIVGLAGRAFGDMIVAGRILSLLSLIASAMFLFGTARRLGASTRAAWAGALFMLLVTATFFRGYVAMDDPQWMAHATMLCGLFVLVGGSGIEAMRGGQVPFGRLAAGAALMVAGGFVKHNLVALPIATTLSLFWLRPRAALCWCGFAMLFLLSGAILVWLSYGSVAFADILHHRRVFRVHLLTHAISRLAPLLPAAIMCAVLLRRRTCGAGAVLAGLFALIAVPTGTLQRMGEGVYYNAHFEAMIAMALCLGLVLDAAGRGRATRRASVSPALLLVLAMLPVLGALPWHLPIAWRAVADRNSEERAWQPVIGALARAKGDVGCHYLSLCYWAGKPFAVDLFNLTQSVLAGGPITRFRTYVASGKLALFEDQPSSFLHADAMRKLGHDPVMDSFRGRYTVNQTGPDDTVLLAPTRR